MRVFCDIAPCSLEEVDRRFCLMMDAESASDTSVYFYDITRRSISESCLSSSWNLDSQSASRRYEPESTAEE
jgi:hypothetical protein